MQTNVNGSQVVIDCLNSLLAGELAARDQYFIHAQMYADWGLGKLYGRIYHEMEDETLHAKLMIERILTLGGKVNMTVASYTIGQDVPSMLKSDYDLEITVQQHLKDGIALCEAERDFVTRDMLLAQLRDTEEDHAYWLGQQLRLIEMMGLPNYLQSQMGEVSAAAAAAHAH